MVRNAGLGRASATATLSITDGGTGDDDLTADGTIIDQGGPGTTPLPIPALSWWMQLLLVAALAGAGAWWAGRA